MHDVFISYAAEDRIKAASLARLLEQSGWQVWWDRRISAGEPWEVSVLNEVIPILFQPAALATPTPDVQALRLATWSGDWTEELRPLLEAAKAKVGHGRLPDLTVPEERAGAAPLVYQISRVEAVQAALDYCSLALEHELRRHAGFQFTEEDFERMRETYDRLKTELSGPEIAIGDEEFHELPERFMVALYPERSEPDKAEQ